jgi:hypothetical protein
MKDVFLEKTFYKKHNSPVFPWISFESKMPLYLTGPKHLKHGQEAGDHGIKDNKLCRRRRYFPPLPFYCSPMLH